MTVKPCKCGSENLGHYVSCLPMNNIYCRDCGHQGPLTTDSFGAAEGAWNDEREKDKPQ